MILFSLLFSTAVALGGESPMDRIECQNKMPLQEIRFLESFLPDLKSGKKTATTRRGVRCTEAGRRLLATDPKAKALGALVVSRAYVLRFNEISEDLAAAENTSVEGLKRGLIAIYGPDIQKQELTAIHFVWLPEVH